MPKPGPRRTPTNLAVLRGNPGRRPLPPNEPKPRDLPPDKPTWLSPEAVAEWDRLAPELERMGLLTIVDGVAFGVYCQAVADLAFHRTKMAEHVAASGGYTVTRFNKGGGEYETVIPEVALAEKCVQVIRQFSAEFGLTPSARASGLGGVGTSVPKSPGDFQDFLDRRKRPANA